MKAKDLRIGNLLHNHNKEVVAISCYDIVDFKNMEDKLHHDPRRKDWKPIEITVEWFDRFGFVFLPHGFHFAIPGTKINESGADRYMVWFDQYKREFNLVWNGAQIAKLKYIHQLQNLYFNLKGDELAVSSWETTYPLNPTS